MIHHFATNRDLIGGFANAMNLVSPEVENHHEKVSYLAYRLAEDMGMEQQQCMLAFAGGLLHDIGKLKIPNEILEMPGFEQITSQAALHHEKPDGSGYPFHMPASELPLGSRIMTVADIFSAITEDRPYRKSMDRDNVIAILRGDAERGLLSQNVADLLVDHFDPINLRRDTESKAASKQYRLASKAG